MTDSKLLDSSTWLGYFHNRTYSETIESEEMLLLSSLSLFEIKKKLIKNKQESNKINRALELIKKRSLIIDVNSEIAEKAVEISINNNLSSVDSLIYASAVINNASLITLDNDFRKLKDVIVL